MAGLGRQKRKKMNEFPRTAMSQNYKNIEHIGPVLFERSSRARKLNISLKPFKGVRVALPHGISLQQAEKFVHDKKTWIALQQKRMGDLEKQYRKKVQGVDAVDKEAARELLTKRLIPLARKHGFTYRQVTIRTQKSRWGSCSVQNNISLNAKLIRLPEKLVDYVLLHELLHTKIKNHGKKFWAELNRITGDARGMAAELRAYWFMLTEEG
jgi:hypothetical protein